MTPEGLDELRHIVELQEFYTSRNDPAHIKEMDDQFHNLICTISGRQVIADTLRPLHRKIQNYRRSSMADTTRARLRRRSTAPSLKPWPLGTPSEPRR